MCIPSYLIALVVGPLVSKDISPRSRVWAEKEVVDRAAWEFDETEQYLSTAEALLTPYEWGRYDLLCLPSSFPYGGMENPCLTFVTPTLLAGDRSLSSVVAHEIAHRYRPCSSFRAHTRALMMKRECDALHAAGPATS